mgnify:FL=1
MEKFINKSYQINAIIDTPSIQCPPEFLNESAEKSARKFHKSIEEYNVTPLVRLHGLSKKLGLSGVYVKDESYRFGLNAFKALGGSYAVARIICKKLGININGVSFDYFKQDKVRDKIKDIVFVTATDGNHGRGVAWASSKIGCRSVVYLPKGSAKSRVEAIKKAGAETHVTDFNYDDSVKLAAKKAEENGWYLVQDTAFEMYEEVPNWISQGYTTMAGEALEQLEAFGIHKPTHVFLQAGVGSMAGAVLGYYANKFNGNPPTTVIVEPKEAACIYKSKFAGDGKPHTVKGDLKTIMAGLACGSPNCVTWQILDKFASGYITCPDYVSANGMRILANPCENDRKIISGESGAVGVGLLSLIMEKDELSELRKLLGLNKDSVVLLFSTEGNTDPENYNKIVFNLKEDD